MNKIKIITISLLTLLFLIACSDKKVINDWTRDNLKGKVRTIIQTVELKNSGNTLKLIYNYDNQGSWLERQDYDNDGSLRRKRTVTFNSKTNATDINAYDKTGKLSEKWVLKYNNDGKLIEESGYNVKNGKIEFKYTNQYDSNNNLKETNRYDFKDILIERVVYKNDSDGKPIEQKNYDGKGNFIDKDLIKYFDYDEKGNWKNKQILSAENNSPKIIIKRQFTYYE